MNPTVDYLQSPFDETNSWRPARVNGRDGRLHGRDRAAMGKRHLVVARYQNPIVQERIESG